MKSNGDEMILSIVVSTLGRSVEVDRLLETIAKYHQSLSYEVIVVDQNQEPILQNVISRYAETMDVRWLRVSFTGLSRARNYGKRQARGKFILFADDDMEMLPETLSQMIAVLEKRPDLDVIVGRTIDREGRPSCNKWENTAALLTVRSFYGRFVEAAMLFRHSAVTGRDFDERLGCGCFHGSEEGADLVLNMLRDGASIWYDPVYCFYHPEKLVDYEGKDAITRAFSYAAGQAAFCIKNGFRGRLAKKIILCLGYSVCLLMLGFPKGRFYFAKAKGLLAGWRNWERGLNV